MIVVQAGRLNLGKAATGAAILVVGLVLTWSIVRSVIGGQATIGLYALGAATIVFCFTAWRPAVYGVFIALFVEGYLRNRYGSPSILLVKDAMLVAIYIRVFGSKLIRGEPLIPASPLNLPLAIFTLIALIQSINPHVYGPAQAAVGLRTWLFYVPLYYLALEMFHTERDVRRFIWFLLLCAIPICALAVYQYRLGPEAYASQGGALADATFVTRSNDVIIFRPNATFAWPSHFAVFLTNTTLLCLGVLLGTHGRARVAAWLLITMLIGVNLIEGQRSAYITLALASGLVLMLRGKLGTIPVAALVAVGVAVIVGMATDSVGLERVRELTENRGDVVNSRTEGFVNYLLAAVQASPVGLGTGATANGTRYVADGMIPLFVEVPLAKVIGDFSLVGLAAYFWIFVTMCVTTLQAHGRASRTRAVPAASLLACIFTLQLLAVPAGYELAIAAVPLWWLSGMAQALARLGDPQGDGVATSPRLAKSRLVPASVAARSGWGTRKGRTQPATGIVPINGPEAV